MPNWCNNKATFKHKDQSMLVRAHNAFQKGKLLNEFIPIPEELKDTTSGFYGHGTEEQRELMAIQAANVAMYGYPSWYEFANAEWGTKWDIGCKDSDTESESELVDGVLTLDFDSAWSPPIEAYEKLSSMGFEIEAYYYEGGCAFCGIFIGNEEYTDHDEYGIDGDSEWVKRHIPQAINDEFAIWENMAEWEREQAEMEQEVVTE